MFKKLFKEGYHFSVVEKITLFIFLIIALYNIPINFIPTSFVKDQPEISALLNSKYIKEFESGKINSITMTNYRNFINGDCYSKQTFNKYDSDLKVNRTYNYWTKYCTGDSDFLYDFKMIKENGKIKFYSNNVPENFLSVFKDSHYSFWLNIKKPIEYFAKTP